MLLLTAPNCGCITHTVTTSSAPAQVTWRGGSEHSYTPGAMERCCHLPSSSAALATQVLGLRSSPCPLLSPPCTGSGTTGGSIRTGQARSAPWSCTHPVPSLIPQLRQGTRQAASSPQYSTPTSADVSEMEARRKVFGDKTGVSWPTTVNRGPLNRLVAQSSFQHHCSKFIP